MIARSTRIALVLTLAATVLGAASARADEPTIHSQLVVQNRGDQTVSVYAINSSGKRIWLGWVDGRAERNFNITTNLIDENGGLQLVAFPQARPARLGESAAGPAGIRTKSLTVGEGATVFLLVERELGSSLAFVAGAGM